MVEITVITPSYNRANFLKEIFDSLCRQSFKNFEWLVVDDGSNDNTNEVVNDFIRGGLIETRYIQKDNGGKHTAINVGVKEAKGELVLILDSDDCLPKDSLLTISNYYQKIKNDNSIGGVCGYMAHRNGRLIGTRIEKYPIITNSLDMRYSLGIKGDMCEVFRTSVLREFPFPEIAGEKFCPESLIWNRIALKYRLFLFKDVIYFRDYLSNGLTANMVKIRMNSPISAMMTYSEMTDFQIPIMARCKSAINYYRFSFCSKKKEKPKIPGKWIFLKPIGWLMHLKDNSVNK